MNFQIFEKCISHHVAVCGAQCLTLGIVYHCWKSTASHLFVSLEVPFVHTLAIPHTKTTEKLILNFVANNINNARARQRKQKQFTLVTCSCIKKFQPKVWVDKPLLICKMFMLWLTALWIFCCMPAHTYSVCAFFRALCADSINSVCAYKISRINISKRKSCLQFTSVHISTSRGKFIICQQTNCSMAFAAKLLKINTISC